MGILRQIILGYLIAFLMVGPAWAAVVCVGPSASGDGSGADWSNVKAIANLTGGNWTRGNTYYLKEGTYPATTFTTAASGTTYIYIKKCGTEDAACTGLAGYDAADHDGQAIFSVSSGFAWAMTTNYWEIDGITGSANSGHGFKVVTTSATGGILAVIYPNTPTGIRVLHTEFAGIGRDHNVDVSGENLAVKFYDNAATGGGGSHYWAYNYFHDTPAGMFWSRLVGGLTFEYNYLDTNASGVDDETPTATQGSGVVAYCGSDHIYRNNVFRDIEGSGLICLYTGHADGTMCGGSNLIDNVQVYNNVFFWDSTLVNDRTTASFPTLAGYRMFIQDGFIRGESGAVLTNVLVYNNTFSNMDAYRVVYADTGSSSNLFKNNIVDACEGVPTASGNFTGFDHSYNFYRAASDYRSTADLTADWAAEANSVTGTGSPFTAVATEDFTLPSDSEAKDVGVALGPPYNTDILGAARPFGAAWDMGAYEYTTGTTYNLIVTAPTGGTITSADGYINCGTGGIACSYSYTSGDNSVLTFTPDSGYRIVNTGGSCSKATSPQTIAMSEARTCTATFEKGIVLGTGNTLTIGTGNTITLQ